MEDTRRRCEQYECNKPSTASLPEFGYLCESCYLLMFADNRVKTIYIEGDY